MRTLSRINYLKGLLLSVAVILLLCTGVIRAVAIASDSLPVKYAVQAAQLCQSGDYDNALSTINRALNSESEKDALYTWYVKGFIHKEIYKNLESTNRDSKNRELAVEAFMQSKKIVGIQADVYNNNAALKYLANTYYNDAISLASNFNLTEERLADELMQKHENIRSAIDAPVVADKASYYKLKGIRYFEHWQNDVCNLTLYEKSIASFELSLGNNSNDCESYYNEGLVKYTLASKLNDPKIKACYKEQDFETVLESALHSFHEGEKSCPNNQGLIQALFNTYTTLGKKDAASQYALLLKH